MIKAYHSEYDHMKEIWVNPRFIISVDSPDYDDIGFRSRIWLPGDRVVFSRVPVSVVVERMNDL